ncbi:replication protein A 70 kDa DNA-binding subunit C-like [Helianthus annuus]|uniref:replication protein A 70 kDa DNA-binding subunit C-like n=1 Tax=Helianthus annuus TaxID=4232 RepID=UPI001652D24C|nr:replication protein A 70 kDa DNA-binding subunit C-like [Helianthus annuus]
MENNQITMFRSLNAHSTNYTIKAKIISMWDKKMNGYDNQIYRVDMLLMDEEGAFIQCSCLHKLFKRFLKFLVVDDCLLIHKPSLAKDTTKIKVTGKDQKLSFYAFTSVLKTDNWSGPRYLFKFTDFKSVLSKKIEVNTPIDFIGYLVVSYPIEDANRKDGSKTKRMSITLKDLDDQKISVTLWENYAITLSNYMNDKNRPAHVVILVHFGTVNIYQGKVGLTNMFEASRVFINEIKEFKDRYLEKELSKPSSSKQSCSQVILNTEDEFLNAEDFVLTCFIASIDVEKKVTLLKQIEEKSELVERDDGSFDVLDDKSFECINPDCDAVDIVPVHRYKIPLRVQDSTGTISCTLFDYEAIKLLKKTSKELLDIYSKVENYGISMLSSDEDLLSALEKKWKVNESDVSESNVQCLSDSVGNVKGLGKESQSVMGDSVTPDPIDGSDQDPTKFENIKRNLEHGCKTRQTYYFDGYYCLIIDIVFLEMLQDQGLFISSSVLMELWPRELIELYGLHDQHASEENVNVIEEMVVIENGERTIYQFDATQKQDD